MTKLIADLVQSRENNFNLLRMLAAGLVLFSHAFALSSGKASEEPLQSVMHMTLAQIAVDVFFISSGFLIAKSLVHAASLGQFVRFRCLRILPALWVALILITVVTGLWFSSVRSVEFFSDPMTYTFLLRNAVLVFGIQHGLPGVFEFAPMPRLVNASLWTLPYEVAMYIGLASVWVLLKRVSIKTQIGFDLMVLLIAILSMSVYLFSIDDHPSNLVRLCAFFFSGATLFLYGKKIRLSGWIAGGLFLSWLLTLSFPAISLRLYAVAIPYITLYLALVPAGTFRKYNQVGDYSYGLYIYAWPVQQAIATLIRGITPVEMVVTSFLATLFLAVLSWHFLEKKVLALKRQF
jgi:peptidoglycan/LPS O-acetylase OafA/YrhL